MDIRDFQRLVLEKAKEAGFSDCEIYYRKDESFQAAEKLSIMRQAPRRERPSGE